MAQVSGHGPRLSITPIKSPTGPRFFRLRPLLKVDAKAKQEWGQVWGAKNAQG